MPCRCDYEEPSNNSKYEDEHLKRCRAQSLVHKLSMFIERHKLTLSPEVKKRVDANRAELLAHKKQEHDSDMLKLESEIYNIQCKIKQIVGLGGDPRPEVFDRLKRLQEQKAKEKDVSNENLLGPEHY